MFLAQGNYLVQVVVKVPSQDSADDMIWPVTLAKP